MSLAVILLLLTLADLVALAYSLFSLTKGEPLNARLVGMEIGILGITAMSCFYYLDDRGRAIVQREREIPPTPDEFDQRFE